MLAQVFDQRAELSRLKEGSGKKLATGKVACALKKGASVLRKAVPVATAFQGFHKQLQVVQRNGFRKAPFVSGCGAGANGAGDGGISSSVEMERSAANGFVLMIARLQGFFEFWREMGA